jgi:hypothetical protein
MMISHTLDLKYLEFSSSDPNEADSAIPTPTVLMEIKITVKAIMRSNDLINLKNSFRDREPPLHISESHSKLCAWCDVLITT